MTNIEEGRSSNKGSCSAQSRLMDSFSRMMVSTCTTPMHARTQTELWNARRGTETYI